MKTYSSILMLLVSLLFFASCEKDDEVTPETTNTIVDVALADPQFSTLVSALQRTNLVSTLQSDGPFTVFAPTNAAFAQLGVDLATISDNDLTNILLYHVLPGQVRSTDLSEGQTYATTASTAAPNSNQLSILIERASTGVTLNGSSVVTGADVIADNGIIHVIDQVVTPLNIVGHAAANSNFSSLVSALSTAPGGLVDVLSGTGPFTVFAPLNSAFEAIAGTVAELTPDQLATVLTYHVIGGANVRSTDLEDNMIVETVNGQTFTIDLENGATITDQSGQTSQIVLTDVQATNGVIHVLEKVIIPSL
ncbi:MAG: fasciclin domain-containing protein [Saprospiraceae bacterium]|nr:fasciclin domain-containing protein [Saprospiraceae bacterium]